ncbi:MAG TPA: alanyl-tRNA editing protein [Vicinamibacterales bacterium]|nr:alanyl-tRNA editing protein [Vicinamibacterales bacterium]
MGSTTRLYYTDALLREFDATVVSSEGADGQVTVVLDQTAFYPTSGGQPFDRGRLGAHQVLDVIDDEAGTIRHVVDGPIAAGERVHGTIDWPRRLDHMQQHTGQHVLSAAFDRLCSVRTVSFHLGAETATIDLAREVSAAEIARAEAEANRVVWENRPVTVRFATEEEASRLPLRKEPVRSGTLRLVDVTEFDLSACGGTHVPATGMIGVIAIAGWERFKGASRVAFVCGGRALRGYGQLRDAMTAATRALSVSPADVAAAIERMQADAKDLGRTIRRLQDDVAASRAATLRAGATDIGGRRGVLRHEPGWDAAGLKTLASAIVSEPGTIAILIGDGTPAPVVVARSADVDLDAAAWMKQAAAALGGRGGGRPELAQGGLGVSPDRILTFAKETLK